MNKKGSLEMSMNSIVVIILAVIFVTVVIAFFQTVFEKQQDNVLSLVDNFPNVNPPTANEPFKIPKDEIELEVNELRQLEAYFLYRGEGGKCVLVEGASTGSEKLVDFTISPVPLKLKDGSKVRMDFQIKALKEGFGITPIQLCCETGDTSPLKTDGACTDDSKIHSIDMSYNIKK